MVILCIRISFVGSCSFVCQVVSVGQTRCLSTTRLLQREMYWNDKAEAGEAVRLFSNQWLHHHLYLYAVCCCCCCKFKYYFDTFLFETGVAVVVTCTVSSISAFFSSSFFLCMCVPLERSTNRQLSLSWLSPLCASVASITLKMCLKYLCWRFRGFRMSRYIFSFVCVWFIVEYFHAFDIVKVEVVWRSYTFSTCCFCLFCFLFL